MDLTGSVGPYLSTHRQVLARLTQDLDPDRPRGGHPALVIVRMRGLVVVRLPVSSPDTIGVAQPLDVALVQVRWQAVLGKPARLKGLVRVGRPRLLTRLSGRHRNVSYKRARFGPW